MPTPTFEFTDRATPIVQFGRSEVRQLGNDRWTRSRWGHGRWGADDWEPIWSDATCEIHEITTNTGRGPAPDRFIPGTALIVASNMHGLSGLVFPELAPPEKLQLVPQPPVANEEELQAPGAATIVSNGWSFSDDFERVPPRWIFPGAWATGGTFPCGPFKQLIGDVWAPPVYRDPALTGGTWFEGSAAAQWTGVYAAVCQLTVTVNPVTWPAAPTAGSPTVVYELYARMTTTNKACQCLRVTYTPGFAGADNTITLDLFRMAADGSRAAGGTPQTVNLGATNGAFPAAVFTLDAQPLGTGTYMSVSRNGSAVYNWVDTSAPAGNRIGVFCRVVEGKHTGTHVVPEITAISTFDFDDDLTRPTGSGWYLPKVYQRTFAVDPMIVDGGAMRPPETFAAQFDGVYRAKGVAQFDAEFTGDQYFEFDITDVSMPTGLAGPCETFIEVLLHANRHDVAAVRCIIDYIPDWGPGSETVISWRFYQSGSTGDSFYDPGVFGDINLGATDGVFPEPARWRVESDLTGENRLFLDGTLIATAMFPDPPTGGRVGISVNWQAGGPVAGNPRPTVARLERVSAGLREPLGTEELGTWVRIGVDHQTLGKQWFFRGFVDGMVPTYIPERPDAVRIECIDALGEAGRARILDTSIPHRIAEAHTRIRQILNVSGFPRKLCRIGDDATAMSRPSSGKAVDALTHVAESCGGAVYGDPDTGEVVFWGQDWQAFDAGSLPQAFITNFRPDDEEPRPRVCPVGWEMSQRRQDMNTRARFSTVTSDTDDADPIVREWRSAEAEAIYGIELAQRTVLCVTRERVDELASRHLRLRSPRTFPRVEAVLLDAATADEALDLMTTAQFHRPPSRYQCQLRRDGEWVFNRQYLVTGVRHQIAPHRWTCRLQLDIASAFVAHGARWGRDRWNRPEATWGRTR
jgi:hypothetical protein